jgi:hypothetical protein
MKEIPWTWKLDKSYENGIVDATIHSCDNKTQFNVKGIPGKIVDGFVALLTSSYKWGCSEYSFEAIIDKNRDKLQPSAEEIDIMVQGAVKPLLEVIAELKDQKIKDAQAIGGLKGTITRLKNKYGDGIEDIE